MHRAAAVVPALLTALWLPPAAAPARPPVHSAVVLAEAPSPQASFFTPSSAAPRPSDVSPSNGRRNSDTTWVILGLLGGGALAAAAVWAAARRRGNG